jgi:hypothetical protein
MDSTLGLVWQTYWNLTVTMTLPRVRSAYGSMILQLHNLHGIDWEGESNWWTATDVGRVCGSFEVLLKLDLLLAYDSNVEC